MWQDIERISGLPFSQLSPGGVDADLYSNAPNAVTTLDFGVSEAVNEVEIQQLQHDLLRTTNHAAAVEIDDGNERERNRALNQTVRCLEEENTNLQDLVRETTDKLQDSLQEKDSQAKDIGLLHRRLTGTQEGLASRVKGLENDLTKQKEVEENLMSEHSKISHELDESKSQIHHLKESLSASIHASKERESKAISMAQTEARHKIKIAHAEANQNVTLLETKLLSTEQQLEKAESRERQASFSAQESRQEATRIQQKFLEAQLECKDASTLHRAEIQKMHAELEKIQQAKLSLERQLETTTNNLKDAENRIKEKNHEIEDTSAQCDMLQTGLDQTKQSNELLVVDVASLNAKVQLLQKSKDNYEQSVQSLKVALEDERHRHASAMNDLESHIMASIRTVREKISSQQIK